MNTVFAGKYPELENNLKLNVSKFTAYKAFHLTENLKSIESKDKAEFKQIASRVIKKFNQWAATENNTITSRSRTAKQFKQFEEDKDVMPNLKWIRSRSSDPREQHLAIAGTILPINDPFWNNHQPGNLWGCKCDWVQTDEPVNKAPNVNIKAAKGLEGNPAITGEVFTQEHPYFTKAKDNKDVEKFIKENIKEAEAKIEYKKTEFKSGGFIETPINASQNKQEEEKNIETYTILAKKGDKYRLLPVLNIKGRKNPDALNLKTKQLSDAKIPESKNIKNAVQNSIKEASKQKVKEVVINLNNDVNWIEVRKAFKAAFQNGRAKLIEKVIMILKDKEIRIFDVDKIRKVLKYSQEKLK